MTEHCNIKSSNIFYAANFNPHPPKKEGKKKREKGKNMTFSQRWPNNKRLKEEGLGLMSLLGAVPGKPCVGKGGVSFFFFGFLLLYEMCVCVCVCGFWGVGTWG